MNWDCVADLHSHEPKPKQLSLKFFPRLRECQSMLGPLPSFSNEYFPCFQILHLHPRSSRRVLDESPSPPLWCLGRRLFLRLCWLSIFLVHRKLSEGTRKLDGGYHACLWQSMPQGVIVSSVTKSFIYSSVETMQV